MTPTDSALQDYMTNFFGYGNLSSSIWFVGKEEEKDGKEASTKARLKAWEKLGKSQVCDIYDFHKEFATENGQPDNFNNLFNGENSDLHPAWHGLMKLQFAIEEGTIPDEVTSKNFQADKLARKDSNNALLELFPLPATKKILQDFASWSGIECLENKRKYKETTGPNRVKLLKELILEKKPKFVIFYSANDDFIDLWREVAGCEFKKLDKVMISGRDKGSRFLLLGKNADTTFCITQHPRYRDTTDSELLESGKKIKEFQLKTA